jgi:putative ABC transport system substrate-binding protein
MAVFIGRRNFIAALGGVSVAWPLAARAQQSAMPVIGFLNGGSSTTFGYLAAAFRQGLSETGYVEERNVAIEYRWADEHFDQLPAMAEELVRRNVAVLVATGGDLSARAAKRATDTIPIVFALGADPVAAGFVASINRPGGNATGVNFFTTRLLPKQLELLCQLVPNAAVIALLLNPDSANFDTNTKNGEVAGRALGRQIRVFKAGTEDEINIVFARLIQERVDGLVVPGEPLFTSRRDQLTALVVRNAIPAMFYQREFVAAGALASYGENFADNYRQIGIYAGRILNGEKPANLPVQQPSKFELIINLKTAKALDLTVPLIMQMTADEVIE